MSAVVVAYDVGPGIGMGHRRRCEALADRLRERGWSVRLSALNVPIVADTVVLDSYMVRADDPRHVRATHVVALDDIDRDLAVDIVVDPNPGGADGRHRRAATVLGGPAYAPIDAKVMTAAPKPIGSDVGRVLVTTGTADSDGLGVSIAGGLAVRLPDADVHLVQGPWARGSAPTGVRIVAPTAGLIGELCEADLVVTAGGVTMLEALALGRPTASIVTSENQRRAVSGAALEGATVEVDPSTVMHRALALARDRAARVAMSSAARTYVDGRGAERIAREIDALA